MTVFDEKRGYKSQKIHSLIKLNKWIRIWTSKTLLKWWEECKWELKDTQEWLKDVWYHKGWLEVKWWCLEWDNNSQQVSSRECPKCKDTLRCPQTIKCINNSLLKWSQDKWWCLKEVSIGSLNKKKPLNPSRIIRIFKDSKTLLKLHRWQWLALIKVLIKI